LLGGISGSAPVPRWGRAVPGYGRDCSSFGVIVHDVLMRGVLTFGTMRSLK
jgi:hypothetical protein